MQSKTGYTSIGKLIGIIRRQRHRETNHPRYTQEGFIYAGKRQICQQSRLSRIENGLVNRHYMDEIHYLIENLDRIPLEYETLLPAYDTFLNDVIQATQYHSDLLPALQERFNREFKSYDHAFYTAEVNRVLTIHFDLLLNQQLVPLHEIMAMAELFPCFPPELRLLFLNTAGIALETFFAEIPWLEWYFRAVTELKSSEPFARALKAYVHLRKSQFLLAQREFEALSSLALSPYLKFRIARAQQSLAFESHTLTDFDTSVEPAIFHDSSINPFERSRPFMTLGMMYYMRSDWAKSNQWYLKAIAINPYIICIADVFVFDTLLRLNDTETLVRLMDQSKAFLHLYPASCALKQDFFRLLIHQHDTFGFDSLFEHIKTRHPQDPTITIMRRHLMNTIKDTRQYKLLYEFDRAAEAAQPFQAS